MGWNEYLFFYFPVFFSPSSSSSSSPWALYKVQICNLSSLRLLLGKCYFLISFYLITFFQIGGAPTCPVYMHVHNTTTTTPVITPAITPALTVYPGRTSFFDLLLSFIQHPRESVFSLGRVAWNRASTKERRHPVAFFGPRAVVLRRNRDSQRATTRNCSWWNVSVGVASCSMRRRKESASIKRHHSVVALGMSLKDGDAALGWIRWWMEYVNHHTDGVSSVQLSSSVRLTPHRGSTAVDTRY